MGSLQYIYCMYSVHTVLHIVKRGYCNTFLYFLYTVCTVSYNHSKGPSMRAGRGACFHLWTNLTNIKPILGLAILILPLLILYKIQCTHKMNSVAWPLQHAEKSVKLKVTVKVCKTQISCAVLSRTYK